MSSPRAAPSSGPNTMSKFPVVEWSDAIYTFKHICDSMEIFFAETYKKVAEFGLKRHSRTDKNGKPASPHTFKTPKPPRSHIDGRRINLLEKATVALTDSSTIQIRYNVAGAAVEWPVTNSGVIERLKTLDKNFNPKSPGTIKTADITQLLLVADIFNKAVFMCLPSATYRPKDKQRIEDSDHSWGELFILTPFEVLQVVGSLHVRYMYGDQLTDAQLRKKFVECMETLFTTIKKHKASEEHFLTPPPLLQIADDIFLPVCETEVYIYWKPDALKQPQARDYISAPKSPAAKRASPSSSSSKKKKSTKCSQVADDDEQEGFQGEDSSDDEPLSTCRSVKRVRTTKEPSGSLDESRFLPGEDLNIKEPKPRHQEVSDGDSICSSSSSSQTTPKKPATPRAKLVAPTPKKPAYPKAKASLVEDPIGLLEDRLTEAIERAATMEATFSSPEIMRSILLKHFSSAATLKKVHAGTKKQVNDAARLNYKVANPASNAASLKALLADYVPDETMELPATMWSTLAYCAQDNNPVLKEKLEGLMKSMEAPKRELTVSLLTPMDRMHISTQEPTILAILLGQGVKITGELIDAMGEVVVGPLLQELKTLRVMVRNARTVIDNLRGELATPKSVEEEPRDKGLRIEVDPMETRKEFEKEERNNLADASIDRPLLDQEGLTHFAHEPAGTEFNGLQDNKSASSHSYVNHQTTHLQEQFLASWIMSAYGWPKTPILILNGVRAREIAAILVAGKRAAESAGYDIKWPETPSVNAIKGFFQRFLRQKGLTLEKVNGKGKKVGGTQRTHEYRVRGPVEEDVGVIACIEPLLSQSELGS